ncbi:hypothetical protein LAZ67_9002573 [Cordylochernes scorpioides]|uniref:Cadherin domain-containing protein n=1 Tax=Cordylochernes scorpioides TaxID=51811 RepID=A0ABY6KTW9_9ARAC|nr:hypothetical protein LAZ67_9002573 [Cordylochernes scorpioides]
MSSNDDMWMSPGDGGDHFKMEEMTGVLSVNVSPDREKIPAYLLRVFAVDTANNTVRPYLIDLLFHTPSTTPYVHSSTFNPFVPYTANNPGTANVHVTIKDENDWTPTFLNETSLFNVTEGPKSVGSRIGLPIVDYDEGPNRQIEVAIMEGNTDKHFQLDYSEEQGNMENKPISIPREMDLCGTLQQAILTVVRELDREAYGVPDSALHLVVVTAQDHGTPPRTGTATVAVVVHDINDSPPRFQRDVYYEFINENLPVGTIVTTLAARDADSAHNTHLRYSFSSSTSQHSKSSPVYPAITVHHKDFIPYMSHDRGDVRLYTLHVPRCPVPFGIDPVLGAVNVSRQLDVSEHREYSLEVEVTDGLWRDKTALKVVVSEAEERDPRFDQGHYRFAVLENLAGALVGQVELKPRKHRVHGQASYSIVNADVRSLFNITKDGHIFTRSALDREKRASYTFTVMLEERKPSTKVCSAVCPQSVSEVTVDVIDVNDETPTFPHAYTGSIRENSPPGTAVSIEPAIQAVDRDSGNNSKVSYSLSGPGSELFSILDNGVVIFSSSQQQLDREAVQTFDLRTFNLRGIGLVLMRSLDQLTDFLVTFKDKEAVRAFDLRVTAQDAGNLSSTTYLTVTVEDENDNAPVFQHGPLHVLLPETARPGNKIAELLALDADADGPNSQVEYRVVGGTGRDLRVDPVSGELYVASALRPGDVHLLNVSAVDGRGLASFLAVNVTIVDVNDHKPEFVRPEYRFTVPEGDYSDRRTKIGVLHAVDEDTGNNGRVEYTITQTQAEGFPFVVDVYTGELFVQGPLDREDRPVYHFVVMALDNGEIPLNSTVNITVELEDVNDERPRFFTDPYLAQVQENLDPGQKVTQIAAYDGDSGINGQVYYKLAEGHDNRFYIDSKDGTVWTLSTLDYEKTPFFNITVVAYDGGTPRLSSAAKLWVTVVDTEDAVPEFPKSVYTLEVAESRQPGETVYTLDAGKGDFTYSLLSEYYSVLDPMSCFFFVLVYGLTPCLVQPAPLKLLTGIQRANDTTTVQCSRSRRSRRLRHRAVYRQHPADPSPGQRPAELLPSVGPGHSPEHGPSQVRLCRDPDPGVVARQVNIIVGTGQGVRLFPSRVYEVTVFENQLSPRVIVDLNSTEELARRPVHYTIVGGHDYRGLFSLDPDSGRLAVTASLDREDKDKYMLKIRADTTRHRRHVPSAPTASTSGAAKTVESSYHLAFDEALVVVHVGDENDNPPVFNNQGRPLVAAVPLEATFGYQVARVTDYVSQATDADIGYNGAIRYEIVRRPDDASFKFHVDPVSGVIRSMVTFALDGSGGGGVYKFEVKATDREGSEAENGTLSYLLELVEILDREGRYDDCVGRRGFPHSAEVFREVELGTAWRHFGQM